MSLEIRPLSDILGAEITGIDLAKPINDETFAKVHQAHLDYLVIVFRDQNLDPQQQSDFAERFGPLIEFPATHLAVPGHPCVTMISTKREKGAFIGLPDAGVMWHSDQSFTETPSLGSMLFALEVPDTGGDTGFANLYAAYDALPAELRRVVEDRTAVFFTGRLRKDRPDSGQYKDEQRYRPPCSHPIIRTHPESGRKSIFTNQQHTISIDGLPEDEGRDILERLVAHCTREEFVYWHRWRKGDLTFWDNRCTVHKADLSRMDDPTYVRHMHRTMISGDKPF
jgi:taurine dioxygenase